MVYTPQSRSPPPQQGPAPKDQEGGAYPLTVPRGLYESAVEGTVVGSSAGTGAASAAAAPTTSTVEPPAVTHVGLINQGATCYMNSLLQLFFHISYFREAVYRMTTDAADESEIPKAIQNLFFQMQERRSAVSTKCLTDAFGWDEREVFIQHDIQELAAKLRDTLESKMKGTPAEGALNRMFAGYGETVTCTLDREYTSRRKDEFYDVHLPVRDYRTLQESLKSLVAKDQLTGSNQYKVEEEGKPAVYKDAETGYEYSRFPPVLLFHLKRFEMDMMSPTLEMKKVNSAFEFPTSINLSDYEHNAAELKASTKLKALTGVEDAAASDAAVEDVDDPAIYDLYGVIVHRGGVRSGHYYAFIREYDPEGQQWRRWLKYDDDEVTEVSEQAAVDRNFGGTTYTWLNGRQVTSVSTHSAYVLAYMRRGDIKRLIYPISTNAIPAHVKEELERVMREDERLQREEDDRNRTVTLHMILDEAIQQHVGRSTYELVPGGSASPTFGASFSLVLQKQNTLLDLYNAMKERNCYPARLWRMWPPFQGAQLRPDSPLPALDEQSAATTLQEVFAKGPADDAAKAIVAPLYVELPRVHVPALTTNAASLIAGVKVTSSMIAADSKDDLKSVIRSGGLVRFDPADRAPTLTVEMSKPVPATFLSFKVVFGRNAYLFEQTVSIALYDKDPQAADSVPVWSLKRTLTLSSHTSASASVYLTLQERDENQREKPPPVGKWLVIQRVEGARPVSHSFALNRLVWHTTPEMLQQRPASNVPELPEYSKETEVNIMLKVFNHRLARITYAGMAIIPRSEPLRNCFPTFRALMGLPPDSRQSLLLFDESRPYQITKLDEAHSSTNTEANLFSGNIITCQLDPRDIPLVYRFLQADQFYLWLDRMRQISVHSYANPSLVFTTTMQGNNRVEDIVDVIAKHLPGVNPEYIRIYGPHGYMQPTPRTEPERSDSNATLDTIIYTGSWAVPDIFYEVLDRPVSEVEARLVIPLRFATALGEPQGEEHVLTVPVGTPVDVLVNEFLALHITDEEERDRFKRQHGNTFVIVERSAHLIHAYYPTLPERRAQHADDSDDYLARPDGISRVRRDRCYEVRPWTPPLPHQRVIPCGQGDQSQHGEYQPHGTPFLLAIDKDFACDEVLKRLLAVTEIDPATVERGDEEHRNYSLMIYTTCMMFLPDFKTVPLWSYMNGTTKSPYNPTHAFLNRKKPKEKPGSRYVPLHEPQLVLEKKKLPHAKSTDNLQQGAVAAAAAAVPHAPSTPDLDAAKRFLAS